MEEGDIEKLKKQKREQFNTLVRNTLLARFVENNFNTKQSLKKQMELLGSKRDKIKIEG